MYVLKACALAKCQRIPPLGKCVPLPMPQQTWSQLVVDLITDLPASLTHTIIMLIVNCFFKFLDFICTAWPDHCLRSCWVHAHACMSVLPFCHAFLTKSWVTGALDSHPMYRPISWRSWEITVSLTSGYNRQANGQAVQSNQEISTFLRTICVENQDDWARLFPCAKYVQNTLCHSMTQKIPFQYVLMYQLPLVPMEIHIFPFSKQLV